MVFALLIFGTSIAGLAYSDKVEDKYANMKCALYLFVNEVMYGASDMYTTGEKWIGSKNVVKAGNDAINAISGASQDLQTKASVTLSKGQFTNTPAFLTDFQNNLDSRTLKVTNPKDGTTQSVELTLLVKNPSTSKCAVVEQLGKEVEAFKEDLIDTLDTMKGGITTLNTGNTISDARDALKTVEDFEGEINSIKSNLYDYADKGKQGFKGFRIGMIILYTFIMLSVFLVTVGSLVALCHASKWWRAMATIGCALQGVFMVLGFLLVAILHPASVAIIDVCDAVDLKKLSTTERGIFPESVWSEVKICLVEDGDLYAEKDLDQELDFASDSIEGLEEAKRLYDTGNNVMKYPVADELLKYIDDCMDKVPYNATSGIFTNGETGLEAPPNGDKIVWSGCDGGDPTVDDTYLGGPAGLCIPLVKFGRSVSSSVLTARYSSANSFITSLSNLVSYVHGVQDQLSYLKSQIIRTGSGNTYYDNMDTDTDDSGIEEMMQNLNSLTQLDDITKQMKTLSETLKNGLDCSYMKKTFGKVHDSLCGDFLQRFLFTAIILGIISSASVFLLIFNVCTNRLFNQSNPKVGAKKHGVTDNSIAAHPEIMKSPTESNRMVQA